MRFICFVTQNKSCLSPWFVLEASVIFTRQCFWKFPFIPFFPWISWFSDLVLCLMLPLESPHHGLTISLSLIERIQQEISFPRPNAALLQQLRGNNRQSQQNGRFPRYLGCNAGFPSPGEAEKDADISQSSLGLPRCKTGRKYEYWFFEIIEEPFGHFR